jgi:hypothetical protein
MVSKKLREGVYGEIQKTFTTNFEPNVIKFGSKELCEIVKSERVNEPLESKRFSSN